MKKKYNVPELTAFEMGETVDESTAHYTIEYLADESEENSMDFHDYIFSDSMAQSMVEGDYEISNGIEHKNNENATFKEDDDDDDVQIIEDDPEIQYNEPSEEREDITEQNDQKDDGSDNQNLPILISQPRSLSDVITRQGFNKTLIKVNEMKPISQPPKLTPFLKSYSAQKSRRGNVSNTRIPDDSDSHFLKSLVPYFAELNTDAKLRIKEQIRQLVEDTVKSKVFEFPEFKKIRLVKQYNDTMEMSEEPVEDEELQTDEVFEPETILS